jgi:LysM repeat protein
MSKWPACWRIILILLVSGMFSGCLPTGDSPMDEEKDPNFIEGRNYQNAMDYKGAIEAFERAVRANPRNAAAHFELGLLYEKMGDYVSAIYHYQKHLELRPKSEYLETIKQRATACKMELAKTVTFGVVTREVHRDLEKMTNDLALMKQANDALRAQLAAKPMVVTNWYKYFVTNYIRITNEVPRYVQAPALVATNAYVARTNAPPPAPTSRVITPPATFQPRVTPPATLQARVTPLPAQKKTYVVRSGETMAQIARKFGVSLPRLQAANPGVEPKRIRAGQTLTIPAE